MQKTLYNIYKWSNKHEWTFLALIFAILVIVFVSAYVIDSKYFSTTLSQKEFEYCEKVAIDAYNQNGVLLEIPENVTFNKTDREITVGLKRHIGNVSLKIKDGKVITEYNKKTVMSIISCSLTGGIMAIIALFFILVSCYKICDFAEEYEKRQR